MTYKSFKPILNKDIKNFTITFRDSDHEVSEISKSIIVLVEDWCSDQDYLPSPGVTVYDVEFLNRSTKETYLVGEGEEKSFKQLMLYLVNSMDFKTKQFS